MFGKGTTRIPAERVTRPVDLYIRKYVVNYNYMYAKGGNIFV